MRVAPRRPRRPLRLRADRRARRGARRRAACTPKRTPTTSSTITRGAVPAARARPRARPHRARAHRRSRRRPDPRGAGRALRQGRARRQIYWGIGMHLGRPWPQNAKGHLLGDVTDQGKAADDPTSRGNEIGGIAFPFHSDGSDLVGLFCLDAGASGGASVVANVVSIHNDLVRDAPELAAELYAAVPVRPARRAGSGQQALVHDADLQPLRRPALRALHPSVHRGVAPSRRRARGRATTAREAMDRVDAMCADPTYHVVDDDGARRHAVREQLPRAARTRGVHRRPRVGPDPSPQATVARDRRAGRRREAGAVPPRPDRPVLVAARADEERARGLRAPLVDLHVRRWRGAGAGAQPSSRRTASRSTAPENSTCPSRRPTARSARSRKSS